MRRVVSSQDFAPEKRKLVTDACSDDEGDPLIYTQGDLGGGGGSSKYTRRGVVDESGVGVSLEPSAMFGLVNCPAPWAPYAAPGA
jgi:hypothetical protein